MKFKLNYIGKYKIAQTFSEPISEKIWIFNQPYTRGMSGPVDHTMIVEDNKVFCTSRIIVRSLEEYSVLREGCEWLITVPCSEIKYTSIEIVAELYYSPIKGIDTIVPTAPPKVVSAVTYLIPSLDPPYVQEAYPLFFKHPYYCYIPLSIHCVCCDVDLDFIQYPSRSSSPVVPPQPSSSSLETPTPLNEPFVVTKDVYDELHDILQNLMDTPFYIFHNKIKRIIQTIVPPVYIKDYEDITNDNNPVFLPQLPILISSDGKDKLKDDIILYRDHLLVRINTLWSYYKRLLKEFPLPFYTYLEQHWTELIKKSYREYLKVYNYNHDDLMSGNSDTTKAQHLQEIEQIRSSHKPFEMDVFCDDFLQETRHVLLKQVYPSPDAKELLQPEQSTHSEMILCPYCNMSNWNKVTHCNGCRTPFLVPSTRYHIVVLLHGFQGNKNDLRGYRNQLELLSPNLVFVMCQSYTKCSEGPIKKSGELAVKEVIDKVTHYCGKGLEKLEKISFIGHSLGGILARYIVQHNSFAPLRYYCDTYISLSTPHLGSLYGTQLTGAGMKIYRFVKKLEALNELEFADSANIQDTFLYYLNQQPSLKYFKRIILVSSPYDDYVPYSSSRIERGNLTDHNYSVMVENVLHEIPITTTLMRYDVGFYLKEMNVDYLIGRAAHIELLSNAQFIAQFVDDIIQYFT